MSSIIRLTTLSVWLFVPVAGQTPYVLHTVAGGDFPAGSVATQVSLGNVTGIAVDSSGNLAILSGSAVYRVTADGKISVLAETTADNMSFTGIGDGLFAGLGFGGGVTADYQGNLYTLYSYVVQKIDSTGRVSNYFALAPDSVQFQPFATAVDNSGNLYIADQFAENIYEVSPDGSYTTRYFGHNLNASETIAVDPAGNVYVADPVNAVVWKLDPSGNVTMFAGTGTPGTSGDGGPATSAMLQNPQSLATDTIGNVYIAEGTIRKVDPSGIITTVWTPSNSFFGLVAVDANGNLYAWSEADDIVYRMDPTRAISTAAGNGSAFDSGDGGPAASSQLGLPRGMLLDASGNLLIADFTGEVRKVNPQGIISTSVTQVPNPQSPYQDDTPQSPWSVAYDSSGNLVIADYEADRILSYTPSGAVSTIAGTEHMPGNSGDGGPATQAKLGNPIDAIFDASGNLLISDVANHAIRKVDKNGIIATIAGTGTAGFGGDGGPATKALLYRPYQITLDVAGNLYIADSTNQRIRKIDTNGIITTVAGNGQAGSTGDGGQAVAASLQFPHGVAVDGNGNLFIAQYGSVRQVDSTGVITTIAGGGTLNPTDGIPATDASLGGALQSLLAGPSGQVYLSDGSRVYRLTPGTALAPPPVAIIDSYPQNLSFTISGDQCPTGTYTSPVDVTFTGSNTCTIAFNPMPAGPRGGRYVFTGWSDDPGAANTRAVTAPAGAATGYFANFQLQFPLTLSIQPAALAGLATITAVPTSPDGYYGATAEVQITANAPPGYVFTGFSGALTGKQNGQTLILNAAETVVANFSISPANAGIFRQGFLWVLDVDGNQKMNIPPDSVFAFGGIPGDIPITGDWNGDGRTKIGIYRSSNGLWILDTNGNGVIDAGDAVFNLHIGTSPGDIPVVGDWNGDGRSKVGYFRQGFLWILDTNGNHTFDQSDQVYAFGGIAGDVPVVGDWTGTGTSKIGIFRQGFLWILDANGNGSIDASDYIFPYGGIPGDVPVVGDWTGAGITQVGIFRQGFLWALDANGNHQIDGPNVDYIFGYGGIPGDKPVVGKW